MQQKTICFFCGDVTQCGGTERVSTMIANLLHRQGLHRVIFLSLMEHDFAPFFPLQALYRRFNYACGSFPVLLAGPRGLSALG